MSKFVFEIGINLIEALISADFITKYLGAKYSGVRRKIGFIGCWLALFSETTLINKITEFETVATYIPIMILLCYSFLFLNGNKKLKIWISALTHLIVVFTSIVTNILICQIIGYDPYKMITVFNGTRVIGVIIAKIFHFYITRIVLKQRHTKLTDNYNWVMLIVIPLISVISLSVLMKAVLIDSNISFYNFIGMVCIIIANIITYYFFSVMNKEYEKTMQANLLEQQNENLMRNISSKDAFVREMKTVRHDIKNQLLTISGYAENGKVEEIKEYINILTNDYLQNVLNYIDTGNMAFDAIINSKIAICGQQNIFLEIDKEKNAELMLSPTETAALFGNLLDNAIEAAKETKEKRISVKIQKNENYLIILVKNSINFSVLEKNSALETSKKEKAFHGFGIKSVKNIVANHNGMIQFYEDGNEFLCHIMLPKK